MENKLTDNEIIKALECCIKVDACHECPYGAACLDDKYVSIIAKDALDLINRQNAEIERLNVELVGMRGACESYKIHYDNARAEIAELQRQLQEGIDLSDTVLKIVKSEARKEFADAITQIETEAVKEFWDKAKQTREFRTCPYVYISDGDNLVKEMEGEEVG